ncbi:hypothetical protein [Halanaerobacter jeridensis]|uniref:PAS domain-containing protein n=1 Tax=Halanaerobacter jeridensis TaxID=706427 RepID=A0A938XSU7_9FIRM|nr:hypothetical protein [Halanaerobacter jeridensis]MBM7556878.1 hypothetical protein [Halanaerobacter jeridensis]
MNEEYSQILFAEVFNELTTPLLVLNEDFEVTASNSQFKEEYKYDSQTVVDFTNSISAKDRTRVHNELVLLFNTPKNKSYLTDVTIKKFNYNVRVDIEIKLLTKTGEVLVIIDEGILGDSNTHIPL